jgi:hypothetical protein
LGRSGRCHQVRHLAKAREQIFTRYFKRLTRVKNAAADAGLKRFKKQEVKA